MAKLRKDQLAMILLDFYRNPVARVSIELIISIIAVIFFALFAIRPTLITMADLVKEIADKKELNEQMDLKIASLYTAQTQYEQYLDKFYLLDQSIPRRFDVVNSLKKIEKLAGEEQLVIDNISLSDVPELIGEELITTNFDDYKKVFLDFNIAVVGNYAQIRSFVEKVMFLRQSIIIDRVTFDKETESNDLSATIGMSLPYYSLISAKTKQ